MDLNQYCEDNLDNLIDTLVKNENKKEIEEKSLNDYVEEWEEEKDYKIIKESDDQYYMLLINKFMEYYNIKFGKNNHLYENLKNEMETNFQMELFYKSIYSLNDYREFIGEINNYECMKHIYKKEDFITYEEFNDKYVLEFDNEKLYCHCLLIALNYIIINKIDNWIIFDLTEE